MKDLPRFYYRNKEGYYDYPLYNYPLVWFLCCVVACLICSVLSKKLYLDLSYFENVFGILGFSLGIYLIARLVIGIKENHSVFKYFSSLVIADSVRKALLNGMNVNRVKDSPFIEVPNVKVTYQNENEVALVVGKLVGMHDLDKISEDVSSCLRGIYNSLAVVSSQVSLNGTNFEFCLENVDKSYRFVVKGKDVSPFLSKNVNEIKLSKNLVWDTNATPMLSVIGHTRSGKTVFADYLLKVMSAQGWEIHYYSAKPDIYVKRFKGESDPRKIVEAVEQWNKIMSERNNEITKAGARTFTELGMKKIGLFIDELGLLNGRLSVDKKLERRWIAAITGLMGAGASSGITVVALSQRATKDYFLPSSALVNAKDAVIMLGLAADSGDDRRALIPGFDIAHCAYGQGQGLAMIVSSGSHWEQPEFYETPYFKELEKKDKNKS